MLNILFIIFFYLLFLYYLFYMFFSRPRRVSKWDTGPVSTDGTQPIVTVPAIGVATNNFILSSMQPARNNVRPSIKTECLEAASQAAAKVYITAYIIILYML